MNNINRYKDELAEVIASTSKIASKVIVRLLNEFSYKRYEKGEFFAKQGEQCNYIGYVCEGLFSMHIIKEDGTEYTKTFIKPKEFLMATFKPEEESTINIQALQDSHIIAAKYSGFQKTVQKYPEVQLFVKTQIETYLERVYKQMEELATLDAKARYLKFIDEHADIAKQIPQYVIASFLAITPTQLSRIRKDLAK
ncbi:MAG: hypothetical protein C0403_06865 [Desulfobacterium sp.]|nr:hypothetical protein [Desulfobacterium sp.]